ncbi:MAG: pyridoxamine 5-phosphate oxidase-related FMN-binding protein [Thermoleophilia bacterium]|nr:pyridoxamine 5-phosphate oxidase-related FMN-binding protein [Thermoleophilia bacterium]
MDDDRDDISRLGSLLEDIDFCMLTTRGMDGTLHARPMSTQRSEFDGTLRFLTDRDSHKADDIEANPDVLVTYSDTGRQTYVSVHGRATLARDEALIEELWSPVYKAWWPEGKEDPSITVLSVEVVRADYWDSPGSKFHQLLGFAKAVAGVGSGQDLGEQGTIRP